MTYYKRGLVLEHMDVLSFFQESEWGTSKPKHNNHLPVICWRPKQPEQVGSSRNRQPDFFQHYPELSSLLRSLA